jgi:cystathionine beta-lyase
MIFISNPHNPVGRVWKKEELEELVEICNENKVLIISDEIHSDLVFKPNRHIPIASLSQKAASSTITLMAPSKTFNMAGLSTSLVIIQNHEMLKTYNKALEATHLSQGNIFGTAATEAAYRNGEKWLDNLLKYINQNIDLVENMCANHPNLINLVRPEATYLLWLDMRKSGLDDTALKTLFFEKTQLGVNQGVLFGAEGSGFMRMNVAMPRQIIAKAIYRLNNILNDMEV